MPLVKKPAPEPADPIRGRRQVEAAPTEGADFPRVPHGGWKELLVRERGLREVTLDEGTFLLLWDYAESRKRGLEAHGDDRRFPEFYAAICRLHRECVRVAIKHPVVL